MPRLTCLVHPNGASAWAGLRCAPVHRAGRCSLSFTYFLLSLSFSPSASSLSVLFHFHPSRSSASSPPLPWLGCRQCCSAGLSTDILVTRTTSTLPVANSGAQAFSFIWFIYFFFLSFVHHITFISVNHQSLQSSFSLCSIAIARAPSYASGASALARRQPNAASTTTNSKEPKIKRLERRKCRKAEVCMESDLLYKTKHKKVARVLQSFRSARCACAGYEQAIAAAPCPMSAERLHLIPLR